MILLKAAEAYCWTLRFGWGAEGEVWANLGLVAFIGKGESPTNSPLSWTLMHCPSGVREKKEAVEELVGREVGGRARIHPIAAGRMSLIVVAGEGSYEMVMSFFVTRRERETSRGSVRCVSPSAGIRKSPGMTV